jgi:predicted RNA-binding Zn-ribbon protein involved in translation (DUF1610 family)
MKLECLNCGFKELANVFFEHFITSEHLRHELSQVRGYKCPHCGIESLNHEDKDSPIRLNEEYADDILREGNIIGKADYDRLMNRVLVWLIDEADIDEATRVVGLISNTNISVDENNNIASVYDMGEYSGLFYDVLEMGPIAMCDNCGKKSDEIEFRVYENGEWFGDMVCPKCGETSITVNSQNI